MFWGLEIISRKFRVTNIHLFRQVMATFASCLLSISGGLTFGHSAVLIPQLKLDKHFPYDKEYDSWIASIAPFAMIFGCLCSGQISDSLGRRKGQLLLIFPFTLGWIVTGMARHNATLIVGRIITGVCTGAVRSLGAIYISEVSDPKYRSTTLFCPNMSIFIGGLMCHLIGHYLPWQIASYIFALPNILCLIIQMWLKESPLWLITKGHKEKGVEAFLWFRGNEESAEKELQMVLESQDKQASSSWNQFVFTKAFLKSIVTIFFVMVSGQLSGINTVTFYAIDMFQLTFGGEINAFTVMIGMDVLRVMATGLVCFIAKRLPTKLSFVVTCFGTTLTLVGLVIILSVKPVGFVWAALACLIAYIVIAGVMVSLGWSFVAEIFPNKIRGFGSSLGSFFSFLWLFISVKVTPIIMASYGETAMYGSFAVVTLIASVILIFILPETQGKTLQDIENDLYSSQLTKESENKNVTP